MSLADHAPGTSQQLHSETKNISTAPPLRSIEEESERRSAGGLFDADEKVLAMLNADVQGAASHWRDLYYDVGASRSSERELSAFTRTVMCLAQSAVDRVEDDDKRVRRALFYRLLVGGQLCTFMEDIVGQEDFYTKNSVFVMNIFIIVTAIMIHAHTKHIPIGQARSVLVALCITSWNTHMLLVDDPDAKPRSTFSREDYCLQLRSMMLIVVLSPGDPFDRSDIHLRRASFLCWLYFSEDGEVCDDQDLHNSALLYYHAMVESPTGPDPEVASLDQTLEALRDSMPLDVVPKFGLEPYMQRLSTMLRHPGLLDRDLDLVLVSACKSILFKPELVTNLASSGVLVAILEAVDRQALRGEVRAQSQSLYSLVGLYTLTLRMSVVKFVPGLQAITPALIRDGCLVDVEARALRVCVTEGQKSGMTYGFCLHNLKTFKSCALAMNSTSSKNITRKILRRGFREHWYPTLHFLRRTRTHSASVSEHDCVVNAWKELGEEMGFEEGVQKAQYERDLRKALRLCSWHACRYHKEEPPVSLRSRCKGCAEVRYCSRACQRGDWDDGHQQRCRRLEESVPTDATS